MNLKTLLLLFIIIIAGKGGKEMTLLGLEGEGLEKLIVNLPYDIFGEVMLYLGSGELLWLLRDKEDSNRNKRNKRNKIPIIKDCLYNDSVLDPSSPLAGIWRKKITQDLTTKPISIKVLILSKNRLNMDMMMYPAR